ncbi:MAG TPA: universal stress protein [Leptolyngbyaceae cyanobacterium]
MFGKILVALDMSVISRSAFEEALTLAKAVNGNLMLLHVLSSDEEGTPPMPNLPSIEYYPALEPEPLERHQKQWEAWEKQGLDVLKLLANQANAAGVSTEFTQLSGTPGRTICEFAQNWKADLIMIGRRGRSGLRELFLGSVSNYVLHHAPCSVLTVQHPVTVSKNEAA